MFSIHNEHLRGILRDDYTLAEIRGLSALLHEQGTFEFPALPNGLFPAASLGGEPYDYTGYSNVWVRDNIHIAHAHFVLGRPDVAVKTLQALMTYFRKHAGRFASIIDGTADHFNVMNRPHIRFNGHELSEIDQQWAHAQNDALGYFLWLYCKLAIEGHLCPEQDELAALSALTQFFETVQYWEDEDSGHWEENRKISASSIGVATAGLQMLRRFAAGESQSALDNGDLAPLTLTRLDRLIEQGQSALREILPAECVQAGPNYRRYDAALLFLIYPMQAVDAEMEDRILADVIENLQGQYGIRRYLGDSYWCADYKTALPPDERTADFSGDMASRDRLLKPGQEAQWCIFDPIISVIYGLKFQAAGLAEHRRMQTYYLNRSLGQLTGSGGEFPPYRCPESYYCESGRYVPNDVTPLLWTQANLALALRGMETTLLSSFHAPA